jgi:DNA-binding NarL/FixJ family response regulator
MSQCPGEIVKVVRVLIADDHEVVRRGLKEILIDAIPGMLFSEAGNGDEALRHLAGSSFDLLLLDLNMPGNSGLNVLGDVKRRYPELPVMIVTGQPESQYANRCMRAGAAAFITKDRAPEELAQAARTILGGAETNRSDFGEVSE